MNFNSVPDNEIDGKLPKKEILEQMGQQDKHLSELLTKATEDTTINWFGSEKHLSFHISALVAHESMHIGQIIAFSYVLDLPIPDFVANNWGLSGR